MGRLRRALLCLVVATGLGCGRGATLDRRPLSISVFYDLDTLEPGRRDRVSDFAVLSNIYEPLVTTDARLAVRPALAARWYNPDERTWVFQLQEKARFHDGRPLTAEDVVFSFQRLIREPELEARRHVSAVEEVRAVSGTSVQIRTRTPLADFLNRIRFVHIVPAGSTREGLARKAVGTGPYRLESHVSRREVSLVRNEEYWGSRPAVSRAVVRLNRMPADALSDFLTGKSDLVQSNCRAALEVARGRTDVVVHRNSSLSVKMLGFDVAHERTDRVSGGVNPFRDRRVREAVQLALDRTRLVGILPAPATPAYQLVPRSIFGYSPSLPSSNGDPARARALLADAGWPLGFDVTLHTREHLADGAEVVKTLLAEVGIRVKVRSLPEREFFEETRAENRDFVLALTRFACPTGDAGNLVDALLHSPEPAGGFGHVNNGGYASAEVDRLVETAGRTLDMSQRIGILQRVMSVALADLPWLPLYVDEDVYLVRPGLVWEPRLDNYVLLPEVSRL